MRRPEIFPAPDISRPFFAKGAGFVLPVYTLSSFMPRPIGKILFAAACSGFGTFIFIRFCTRVLNERVRNKLFGA
ncbi:MAG: hypothetical protein DBX40_03870 [Clostridiales bacterium]|nr:MAG: hypothetical protein DBX40_03870 [Clostridiales bacterium]